jgi:hypothetical protein
MTRLDAFGPVGAKSVKLVSPNAASHYLAHRFLGSEAIRQWAGQTSLPNLLAGQGRLAGGADLLITKLSPRMSRLMGLGNVLRVPERVCLQAKLPFDETTRKQVARSNRQNIRRIRKNNFSYRVTDRREDFDYFFHDMYLPFIKDRFEDSAEVYSYKSALEMFRHGVILWAVQDGRVVAGSLTEKAGDVAKAIVIGTAGGSHEPINAGAHSALYFFSIEWAAEQGFKFLDMGGSRPSLADGVLVTKRRWGAGLAWPNQHHDLIVHWTRCSHAVRRFLEQTPLIFRDADGLSGITAVNPQTDTDLAAVRKQAERHWISGLKRVIVISDLARSVRTGSDRDAAAAPHWIVAPGGPRECVAAAHPLML